MSATSNAAAEAVQHLTFQLAGEQYAVSVLQVREILRYEPVTTVPAAPAAVHGVLNLRGSVVPVVDLAVRFGLPPTEVGRRTCIVIVETESEGERAVTGVLVDAVSEVLELAPADVEPAPAFGTGVRVDFLRGMARMGPKFALILDLDRVLSTFELMAPPEEPSDGAFDEAGALAEEPAPA